jgi:hypothetical protein
MMPSLDEPSGGAPPGEGSPGGAGRDHRREVSDPARSSKTSPILGETSIHTEGSCRAPEPAKWQGTLQINPAELAASPQPLLFREGPRAVPLGVTDGSCRRPPPKGRCGTGSTVFIDIE